MTGRGGVVGLIGCVLAAAVAAAADPPSAADLAADLGHPLFARREAASKGLWQLGEPARPALHKAATGDDPEAARRARLILDRFDWGLYPDTPPAVAKLIGNFRSDNPGKQRAALVDLLRLGRPADRAVTAIMSRPYPPQVREVLFDGYAALLRLEVPRMLRAGEADRAEKLLALHARGPDPDGLLDYALFLKLQGKPAPTAVPPRAAVFLAKAAGDAGRARAVAAELDRTDPVGFGPTYEALLADLGDWGALARRPIWVANSKPGLAAFRLRLAGRLADADQQLADLRDADLGAPEVIGGAVDDATLALLMNDRVADGLARLTKLQSAPHILTDLLAARLEFDAALDLLDAPPPNDRQFDPRYFAVLRYTRKGLLASRIGRRKEAEGYFTRAADRLGQRDGYDLDEYLIAQLIRAEVKAGRPDLACRHLGPAAVRFERLGHRPRFRSHDPFEYLFERTADAAVTLWAALRGDRGRDESPAELMALVRALLTGQANPADVDRAAAAVGNGSVRGGDEFEPELAVAAVYRAAGRTDDAIRVLTAAADRPGPAPRAETVDPLAAGRPAARGARGWVYGTDERFKFWVELGDLLTDAGKHQEAADRLEQGWRKHPDNPILLYLSGRALVAAGKDEDGRRRMALAHQVPLGNARMRGRFLEELIDRGFHKEAAAERELTRAAAWAGGRPGEAPLGNVWSKAAKAAALARDFAGAAADSRRAIHHLLMNPGLAYSDGSAYLTSPVEVRGLEARAALAAGDPAAAVAKAKACLADLPDNPGLVIALVPELDRVGDKAGADALFDQAWAAYDRVIRAHPESAWAKAAAAKVAAGCRRKLDTALEYAKFAAEAEPEAVAFREVLAEARFRTGDRAGAVEVMSKLLAADRRNHLYTRQLARYRTAGFDAPAADADED